MSDPVTLGLVLTVILILAVVVGLLFTSTPVRRRAPQGATEAFYRHIRGDRSGARTILNEVIERPDAPVEAFLHLGDLLREDGETTRALALHRGILARPQLSPELRRLTEISIADDLLALDRNEEAQDRLAELESHFHDEAMQRRRALALHRLGRRQEAADVWVKRAKPDRERFGKAAAAYLSELAREHLREGQLDAAERYARRAQDVDPAAPTAVAVLGDVQLQRGDADRAAKTWYEGLGRVRGEGHQLLPRLLDLSHRTGKMETLVAQLEELRHARPDHAGLWRAVADLRLRRGDLESFFALIEDPPAGGDEELSAWAGWLRHLRGRGDDAALGRLLARLPDSFGPGQWSCRECGKADFESRQACMHCGSPLPLVASHAPASDTPLLVPGGS